MIGSGGYANVYHPPRKGLGKFAKDRRYIQRQTDQSQEESRFGESARKIFDPKNRMSSPLIYVFSRGENLRSQIRPYRKGCLANILGRDNMPISRPLFLQSLSRLQEIMVGLARLHEEGIIHHDIKIENILYDIRPRLQYYLIDWGMALPFGRVYDPDLIYFHVADNENMPPEYKIFARLIEKASSSDTQFWITNLLRKIQPRYSSLLRHATASLTRRLSDSIYPSATMAMVSDRADVFGMGIVLAHFYKNAPDPSLLPIIRAMIHPDPYRRWSMSRAAHHLQSWLIRHPT